MLQVILGRPEHAIPCTRFVPGYDPRLGTLDEQPYGWAGIANARVSELYNTDSQFSDYGMITLDRDVGGSNSSGFFRLRPTRNDTSRGWLQARRNTHGFSLIQETNPKTNHNRRPNTAPIS